MFTARRSRNQNLSRELRDWAARNYCNVGNSVRPIRVIRAIRDKKIFAKIQETRLPSESRNDTPRVHPNVDVRDRRRPALSHTRIRAMQVQCFLPSFLPSLTADEGACYCGAHYSSASAMFFGEESYVRF